jgi:uncharacterized protein YjbI with pentapeptide repeats
MGHLPYRWLKLQDYDSHRAWVKRGYTGQGQLALVGVEIPAMSHHPRAEQLHHLVIKDSLAERLDFSFSECLEIDWSKTSFAKSSFARATISGQIRGCHFFGCDFGLSKLTNCRLKHCDFQEAGLVRAFMQDVVFQDCVFDCADFTDIQYANAEFVRCSFVGVRFLILDLPHFNTPQKLRFLDCQFQNASWQGYDLTNVTFG